MTSPNRGGAAGFLGREPARRAERVAEGAVPRRGRELTVNFR